MKFTSKKLNLLILIALVLMLSLAIDFNLSNLTSIYWWVDKVILGIIGMIVFLSTLYDKTDFKLEENESFKTLILAYSKKVGSLNNEDLKKLQIELDKLNYHNELNWYRKRATKIIGTSINPKLNDLFLDFSSFFNYDFSNLGLTNKQINKLNKLKNKPCKVTKVTIDNLRFSTYKGEELIELVFDRDKSARGKALYKFATGLITGMALASMALGGVTNVLEFIMELFIRLFIIINGYANGVMESNSEFINIKNSIQKKLDFLNGHIILNEAPVSHLTNETISPVTNSNQIETIDKELVRASNDIINDYTRDSDS